MEVKFKTYITAYRKQKKITQEDLSEKVGVRRETITRLEKGLYNPSLKLAMDIARVLDTDVYHLFEYPEQSGS